MTIPTIHLNGTSKSQLILFLRNAHDCLGTAIEALAECAPHGRDYYPQGSEAFTMARGEHSIRVMGVAKVRNELLELIEKIEEQGR